MFGSKVSSIFTHFKMGSKESRIFLVIALLAGPFFIFLSAPMQAPDEAPHYWRAYQISEFDVMADYHEGRYGYAAPKSVKQFGEELLLEKNPKAKFSKTNMEKFAKNDNYTDREYVYFENSAIYSPLGYLPQSTGIGIGRLLNLSVLSSFYLARFFNFLFFVVCIYFALRLVPIARRSFLVLALLPMSIYLGTSLSPDSTIISLAILSTALILNILFDKDGGYFKIKMSVAFLSILALSLTKNGYALFSVLFLLIPHAKFKSKNYSYIWKTILILTPIIFALLWNNMVYPIAENIHTVLKPDEYIAPKTQLENVLGNPIKFIGIIAYTFIIKSGTLLGFSFVGVFGWLDIVLPYFCYILAPFLLVFALLQDGSSKIKDVISNKVQITILAIASLMFISICLSLYIGYSPINSTYIDGLQGRYFIPLMPLLLVILVANVPKINFPRNFFNNYIIPCLAILLLVSLFSLFNANFLRLGY